MKKNLIDYGGRFVGTLLSLYCSSCNSTQNVINRGLGYEGRAPSLVALNENLFDGYTAEIFSQDGTESIEFRVTDYDNNLNGFVIKEHGRRQSGLEYMLLDSEGNQLDPKDVFVVGEYTLVISGTPGTSSTLDVYVTDSESLKSNTYTINVTFTGGTDLGDDNANENDNVNVNNNVNDNHDMNDNADLSQLEELVRLSCSNAVQRKRPEAFNLRVYKVNPNNSITENHEISMGDYHHVLERGNDYLVLLPKSWGSGEFSEIHDEAIDFHVVDSRCGVAIINNAFGLFTVTGESDDGLVTAETFFTNQ